MNVVANSVGIYTFSPATVSGNTIIGPASGIGISVSAVTDISNNTIQGALWGVYLYAAGTITSNHISNSGGSSSYGVYLENGLTGATVKSNTITGSLVGIELHCNANTVSGNTINGATIGVDALPASFTGVNTFDNVATTTTTGGC
jgi:parallel beta-helix repeat protein/putative cofactor-binding repeat protein